MAGERDTIVGVVAARDRFAKYLPTTDQWSTEYAAEVSRRALVVSGLVTSLAAELLEYRQPQDVASSIRRTADLVVDAQKPFVDYARSISAARTANRSAIDLPFLRDDLVQLLDVSVIAWRTLWDLYDMIPGAQLKNPGVVEVVDAMWLAGQSLEIDAPRAPLGPPDLSPAPATVVVVTRRSRGGDLAWGLVAVGLVGLLGRALVVQR